MNKTTLKALVVAITMVAASGFTSADIIFDHDFENGTAGNLSGAGALGTPAAGTISATGGFVSTTRPAYTTGSNGASNGITTSADGSFNDVGMPAGNHLTATFDCSAAITGQLGAGETTTVDFNLASFGTNNATDFKYAHIVGLSSTGQEVFQLLWRAGSGSGTRELYAREFGQDNTTFAAGAYVSNDGTKILDDVSFGINSTNTGAQPTGTIGVSIVIDQFGWNASATPSGGSATSTAASGLGIASGATDLASIQFFTSHNTSIDSQNKGVWIDDIFVETDLKAVPEPAAATLFFCVALAYGSRRRRSA